MKLGKILKGLSLILIIGIVLVVVIGVFMESKLPAQEESNSLTLSEEGVLPDDEAAIEKANELGYKSIIRPPHARLVTDHPKSPLIVYYQKKREQKYLYEALGLNPPTGIMELWLEYYFIGPEDENIVAVLDFQSGEILGVLENVTIGRPEKY